MIQLLAIVVHNLEAVHLADLLIGDNPRIEVDRMPRNAERHDKLRRGSVRVGHLPVLMLWILLDTASATRAVLVLAQC